MVDSHSVIPGRCFVAVQFDRKAPVALAFIFDRKVLVALAFTFARKSTNCSDSFIIADYRNDYWDTL